MRTGRNGNGELEIDEPHQGGIHQAAEIPGDGS